MSTLMVLLFLAQRDQRSLILEKENIRSKKTVLPKLQSTMCQNELKASPETVQKRLPKRMRH
jgi:hypothetical protein